MIHCELFRIIKPGLSTTVQDLGRFGYQRYGVGVSGAMDSYALQIANILVGNDRNASVLEITQGGLEIQILQDCVIALTGADFSAQIDAQHFPMWKSLRAKAGQLLSFGQPKYGMYTYLAVAGGIDVPVVMGSRSTYMRANLGGFHGRALKKNDVILGRSIDYSNKKFISKRVPPMFLPNYQTERKIRVIVGPDLLHFTKEAIQTFLSEEFELTTTSDRMGYRLKGPTLGHMDGRADILSDAIMPGTIQVPGNGDPIILLADRQTTGGFPRIATVITVDLPYVVQRRPGEQLSFEAVTVEEAQKLYREKEKFIKASNILRNSYS
ncbi:biotin-dependent carboxyltransferase family protein [Caldibacillus lycopersici]|uniref:Biotin-dependent carboxyltransferase family protein n=1 Tax=Perspicuibacillus lycopersici TaxID=1325689 RepID=A0AAE3LTY6_9BACI|nr:biotin-dependent carboxyltransferase family protein [Perspicuibacillus lycopersici]MCU9614743.1 biotin-dependent carboxyltransferase family protein [Perspicuibacillus lycopersici]